VRTQVDRDFTTVDYFDRPLGLIKNLGRHTEAEQLTPAAASNGSTVKAVEAPPPRAKPVDAAAAAAPVSAFRDAMWVHGTWDLTKFEKGGVVDWDAVIDAGEAPIPFY
jgi:hypothetical protein